MIKFDSFYFELHPFSRFLVGFTLLSLSALSATIAAGSLLTLAPMLLIRLLEDSWRRVLRLTGVLRWFVVPIVVLHAIFTPGQYLFPSMPWLPVTHEGLQQGLQLSLHLGALFFSAAFLYLSLRSGEWYRLLLSTAYVRRKLGGYMVMLASMRQSVAEMLQALRLQWQLRKRWADLPMLLVAAFRSTLIVASDHAQQLWMRWPDAPAGVEQRSVAWRGSYTMLNTLSVAGCFTILVYAWLI